MKFNKAANRIVVDGQWVDGIVATIPIGHPLHTGSNYVDPQHHVPLEGGTFNWGQTETGLVYFSYTPGPGQMRPGHGGDWSSNSMTFERVTGLQAIEVVVEQGSPERPERMVGHVLLESLMPYLPEHIVPVKDESIGAWSLVERIPHETQS